MMGCDLSSHSVFRFLWMALFAASAVFPAWSKADSKTAEAKAVQKEEAVEQGRFTFANVHRRAAELAAAPFQRDRPELPDFLKNLDYDRYRDIRFQREKAIWRGQTLPFEVQLLSRGFLYHDRVAINLIEGGEVKPISYQRDLFDFGRNPVPPEIPQDIGFAGFRLTYPLNRDDHYDDVAVFLGASYFRAIGQKQQFGISGRGLAIDTAAANAEEFPVFREFWIEQPTKDAIEITVYALLDSPRATGAYRFIIRPGLQTVMDVKAHLFMRDKVEKLGIAPLTSMFFHGELTERYVADFRPEVHDSDGLIVVTGNGERIWRPLNNPRQLQVTTFATTDPRGFGLMQRDRDFENYQDLEANYQARPSVMVEPKGKWGKGVVELVEIPIQAEKYDNIVAFWRPEKPVEAGQELDFEYRLRFALDPEGRLLGGRILSTRIGAGGSGEHDFSRRKFVIDFGGPSLLAFDPNSPIEAVVSASSGKIVNLVVQHNPQTGGRRVFFEFIPDSKDTVDLRCFLRLNDDVLTETWSYQWKQE